MPYFSGVLLSNLAGFQFRPLSLLLPLLPPYHFHPCSQHKYSKQYFKGSGRQVNGKERPKIAADNKGQHNNNGHPEIHVTMLIIVQECQYPHRKQKNGQTGSLGRMLRHIEKIYKGRNNDNRTSDTEGSGNHTCRKADGSQYYDFVYAHKIRSRGSLKNKIYGVTTDNSQYPRPSQAV
jgi:hypothetical protein